MCILFVITFRTRVSKIPKYESNLKLKYFILVLGEGKDYTHGIFFSREWHTYTYGTGFSKEWVTRFGFLKVFFSLHIYRRKKIYLDSSFLDMILFHD